MSEPLSLDVPETTLATWRASVDAVLARGRGEPGRDELDRLFAKVLTTTTDDGIVLQPLYTADDAPPPAGLPGQPPFVRSARPTGPPPGWDVRQRVDARDPRANEQVLGELQNGATSVWLRLGAGADLETLDAVLAGVHLEMVPLVLDADDPSAAAAALAALAERRGLPAGDLRAVLGFDPLGRLAATGRGDEVEPQMRAAVDEARRVASSSPGVRALVVDTTGYHAAGATEADELALSLATGVAYLRALTEAGLGVPDALGQLEFRYAATDDQFLTLARLRAARRLWARVAEACGAPQAGAQTQHAVTSRAMLTRYDPWVNLLRTTVACFAAGLGGADAVTVEAYDTLLDGATDRGRRLARNTQTILLEESHLGSVIDPAGGSWFVESLTDELARTAWARFQQVEQAGGMRAAWDSGLVRAWLDDAHERRRDRVAHRRRPITGVSEFPLLAETVPPAPGPAEADGGLPVRRWAEPFERLRDRAARHREATGSNPTVFLAPLGPLAEHNARASFCTNLFAAGGIEALSPGPVTAEDVGAAFRASGARLACIVGSNDRYAQEAAAVAEALSGADPARLYLAGDPGDLRGTLDEAGVDEYVVAGGDAVALLGRALDAAEVQA